MHRIKQSLYGILYTGVQLISLKKKAVSTLFTVHKFRPGLQRLPKLVAYNRFFILAMVLKSSQRQFNAGFSRIASVQSPCRCARTSAASLAYSDYQADLDLGLFKRGGEGTTRPDSLRTQLRIHTMSVDQQLPTVKGQQAESGRW